jgi:hypothetical protein
MCPQKALTSSERYIFVPSFSSQAKQEQDDDTHNILHTFLKKPTHALYFKITLLKTQSLL